MKNILLTLAIGVMGSYSIASTMVYNQLSNLDYTIVSDDWVKADHWVCKDNKTWFKYVKADDKLWKSTNRGRNWFESKDGMWNNEEGKFLKISYGKVVWTTDSTQPWQEVPEWKWQGGDKRWYKFDQDWNLLMYEK